MPVVGSGGDHSDLDQLRRTLLSLSLRTHASSGTQHTHTRMETRYVVTTDTDGLGVLLQLGAASPIVANSFMYARSDTRALRLSVSATTRSLRGASLSSGSPARHARQTASWRDQFLASGHGVICAHLQFTRDIYAPNRNMQLPSATSNGKHALT